MNRWIMTWSGLMGITAILGGLAWASQTVEMPVWSILVLTFVPLESIVDAIKTKLPKPEENTA